MAMNYSKEKPKKQGTPMLTYVAIILALAGSGGTAAYTTEAINSIETVREIPVSSNIEEITILQQTAESQQENLTQLTEQLEEMRELLEELKEDMPLPMDEERLDLIEEQLQQMQSESAEILAPLAHHSHEGIASELQGTNEGLSQVSNNFKEFRNDIRETTSILNTRVTTIENTITEQADLTDIEQRLTEVEFKVGVLLADFSDLRTAFVNHLEDYAEHLIEFEIARGN